MNIADFIIGLTMLNAITHFILAIRTDQDMSGFSSLKNIIYGLLNLSISIGLLVYSYGIEQITEIGIYFGIFALLIIFFLSGQLWFSLFQTKFYENNNQDII